MKKIAMFFICLFLFSMPVPAQETVSEDAAAASPETDVTHAAVKSFCAWYIKNGESYDGFDAAWQGWLDDPQVPEKFKVAGQAVRENIRKDIASLKTEAADLRELAANKFMQLANELKKSFEETTEATASKWNNFLNQTITGESASK